MKRQVLSFCIAGTALMVGAGSTIGTPPAPSAVASRHAAAAESLAARITALHAALGQGLTVYDATTKPLAAAQVDQLAQRLQTAAGIRLGGPVQSGEVVRFRDEQEGDASAIVEIDRRTRALLLNGGLDPYRGEQSTPGLPAGTVAAPRARNILQDLGLSPPEPAEAFVEHVGGVSMAVHREDGSEDDYRKLTTVRFGRIVDGFVVRGPGSRIAVRLGIDGKLQGLVHHWQTFRRVAAELRAIEDIHKEAIDRLVAAARKASALEVEAAQIVLYDDGEGIMEPALYVVLQLTHVGPRTTKSGQQVVDVYRNPYDYYVPLVRGSRAYFPHLEDLELPARPATDAK